MDAWLHRQPFHSTAQHIPASTPFLLSSYRELRACGIQNLNITMLILNLRLENQDSQAWADIIQGHFC